MDQDQVSSIKKIIEASQDILVVLSQSPTHDHVAAALSIYTSLKDQDKNIQIACSSPMVVEFSRLVGVDKIKTKVGNQNLVVSFDYIQDSIEKVSYHVAGDKFNLVVQPKAGGKPLDPKTVSYSHQGLSVGTIICIGCTSLESIGDIYQKDKKAFDKAHIISIHSLDHPPFAQTSLISPQASSISEYVHTIMSQLGWSISPDVASNLLSGIDMITNRFSAPHITASAFIAAGQLMQAGAQRSMAVERPKIPNIPMPSQLAGRPKPLVRPMTPVDSQNTQPPHPADTPAVPPENIVSPGQTAIEEVSDDKKPNTPKDWLEPKIYRGSTKV